MPGLSADLAGCPGSALRTIGVLDLIKKRDLILIGGILLAALVMLIAVRWTAEAGASVIVRVDGQITEEISLNKTGVYSLNGGTNILHIEGGEAWLSEADCPDKLCVHQGKIHRTGEVITCLPNKLTVTVTGGDDSVDLII
ncbi:MAG: NusG domain II-containing protein [Firmicutes bacterium]|nr:NusG domain II-containing protein [Bacillota bacterium]